MKKIAFALLLLCFFCKNSTGQLWIEDFDGSTAIVPTTSTQCNNNGNSYFGIVCGFGGGCAIELSAATTAYYGPLMGNFLGGRNTDDGGGGCGPGDEEFADWNGIDISSCTSGNDLYLCVDIADGQEDPNMGFWDDPSIVSFSTEMDNAGLITLAVIEDMTGPGEKDTYASFDLDCDEVGDGVHTLTQNLTTYCFEIPGNGNTLRVRVDFDGLNEFGEHIAMDNFAVYCEADPNNLPGILLVSCGDCGADGDCDGFILTEDCDDDDASVTVGVNDADCDGVPTSIDCDDNDPTNTNSNANDADCDGVPTNIDCDDNDASNTNTNVDDADCDGVPTDEDCDDNNPLVTTSNLNDADCDGVPTSEDCDDNDPFNTNTNINDADCDGVPTADDCDDNDPSNTNGNSCAIGPTTSFPCDDGSICTVNDVVVVLDCDGSVCVPCMGTPASCGVDDSCEITQPCNDDDPCTTDDVVVVLLSDGSVCQPCAGVPVDCDTGTTSTIPCDDNNLCTINDVLVIVDCDGSVCVPCMGTPVDCSTAGETSVVTCDDEDPNTVDDVQTILDCDGSICVPCMGVPVDCASGTTSVVTLIYFLLDACCR